MALFHSSGTNAHTVPTAKAERSQIRQLIKKAAHGNLSAFIQATSHYLDLISEYLYLVGYTDPVDRSFEIQKILSDCWRYAPYARRVSDFERFLQVHLENRKESSTLDLANPHNFLGALNHRERFLLVAREFQHWSKKSLKLSLRRKEKEISTDLMLLKSKLIGFRNSMLKQNQQAKVRQVSELLEGVYCSKQARKVEQEIAGNYHVLQYKADWLAYRCELVELKQKMELTTTEKTALKERLSIHLKQAPTESPKFSDNLINHFSFVRLPSN
ncbi:MAG: hypothetical protein AAGB46_10115 [Verrucomicrobiota bacterium]